MLIAAPVFFILEKIALSQISEKAERVKQLIKYKATWLKLLSYLFQLIPFMGLAYLISLNLISRKVSPLALYLTLAALLFGNTASLLMSTYYGHGMTAIFILAMILLIERSQYFWAGLSFGFAVLCDYSGVLLTIPLLLIIKRDLKIFSRFIMGGVAPLLLWIFYHNQCFGSPFHIANQFQNPIYQDLSSKSHNLWGILLPYPQLSTINQLLLGQSRGILWTLPWVFVLLGWALKKILSKESFDIPPQLKFTLVAFAMLLWMNSCFGGWHGGLTPGPRYLSPIFPVFALSIGLCFDKMALPLQRTLFILVIVSLVFASLVYSSHIAPSQVPLWPLYLKINFKNPTTTTLSRLFLIVPLLIFVGTKTLYWPKGTK